MVERQMICDNCRKAVPWSDIKYLPKGRDSRTALCTNCRSKHAPEAGQKKVVNKVETKRAPVATASREQQFFCARCRYKFKFEPDGVTRLRCPYCGNADKVVTMTIGTADKMLKLAGNEK
ncbi:hypothetical protein HYX12_03310 [Candidatus Woesearchaeota archaeon]|nr:hypothetical protein [Candidatus Woesearchaeota archaeon]